MDLPDDTSSSLLATVSAGDNSPPLTVSELSGSLKRTIETAFGQVRVRGEISGFKRHASGHCYFTLKDENACLDAVIWRSGAAGLAFRPEDGAEVIATGKLTTYPGRSKYQIVIDRMELAGEGALLALLEKRRKSLAAEGLFDANYVERYTLGFEELKGRAAEFPPERVAEITGVAAEDVRNLAREYAATQPSAIRQGVALERSSGQKAASAR